MYVVNSNEIQFVPFQKCQIEMAVALKHGIFDPKLVKPKCVWKSVDKQLKKMRKMRKTTTFKMLFWLYHHGVKYAPLKCYNHYFLTLFERKNQYRLNYNFCWIWGCKITILLHFILSKTSQTLSFAIFKEWILPFFKPSFTLK